VIAWVRFAAVVLPPLVLAALFAAWLLATGAWQPFVGQVLFASQASDVKTSGVEIYLVAPRAIWMVLLGLATGLMPRDPARSWARWAVRVPGLAALGAIAWTVRAYALEPAYGSPMGSLVFLLLCGGLVGRAIACALGRRSRRDLILLVLNAGLVAVAWSSAISWGYKTPLLGLVAMGLVLHELLPEEQSLALDVAPAALAAGLVVVSMWRVNELKPYRDVPVAQQSRDLGEAFPRLRGIKTNDFTFARYAEAKALIERWALPANRPFIVVHEYPEIHWLMDQQSPLGIDWLWPNDYRGNEPRLLAELDLARPVVLMMREADSQIAPIPGACPDLRYSAAGVSGVARRVLERGRYLGGGQFFCVYSMD
jgi:hypothetical protein